MSNSQKERESCREREVTCELHGKGGCEAATDQLLALVLHASADNFWKYLEVRSSRVRSVLEHQQSARWVRSCAEKPAGLGYIFVKFGELDHAKKAMLVCVCEREREINSLSGVVV